MFDSVNNHLNVKKIVCISIWKTIWRNICSNRKKETRIKEFDVIWIILYNVIATLSGKANEATTCTPAFLNVGT